MAKEGTEFLGFPRLPDRGEIVLLDGEFAVTVTPVFNDGWCRVAAVRDFRGTVLINDYAGPTTRLSINSPRLRWAMEVER